MHILLAVNIHAAPDSSAVPGAAQLQTLLSGLMWAGLAASIAAVVLGGIAMGLGRHSGNPHMAERGKSAALGGAAGAFLIGAAAAIVTFAFQLGSQVSG